MTHEILTKFPRYGDPTLKRATEEQLVEFLRELVVANPVLTELLATAERLELPDAWIVSGAIYQNVWNALLGYPQGYGIKDYDLIYFDGSDLSWEAEDAVIRRVEAATQRMNIPVEVRNQARVHLWFPQRFGTCYPRLSSATQSLEFYASKTHAVAVARTPETGQVKVHAPFGLRAVFEMELVPNYRIDNKATHLEKSARLKRLWPPVKIVDW